MKISIQNLQADDFSAVARIYAEGIETGNATFSKDVPTWANWDKDHLPNCRFVALNTEGSVVGWAALTPVSGRCVYAGVAELSVYVAASARGFGVGRQLLARLIEASEAAGFWTLQAGIFPENIGSVRLHEAAGFRLVGHRERVGQMDGRWRDTLLFERRSATIGV